VSVQGGLISPIWQPVPGSEINRKGKRENEHERFLNEPENYCFHQGISSYTKMTQVGW